MIPKGDFTKQKYIVGRITDKTDGENEAKTFNFRLPFDNFVGLEDLTVSNGMESVSFLANKPIDGQKYELDDSDFLRQLRAYNSNATEKLADAQSKIDNLDFNYASTREALNGHSSKKAGHSLQAYIYPETENMTFWDKLVTIVQIQASYSKFQLTPDSAYFYEFFTTWKKYNPESLIDQGDVNDALVIARAAYEKERVILTAAYDTLVEEYRQQVADAFDESVYSINNHNHLWSWIRPDNNPVIETKLGIGIDFKTLLGNYRPLNGDYGLRIIISGRTKPTEENNSEEISEEVYLKKSDMYGNVYAFYEPYTQQKIFDISHLLTLNRIDIFFWQDHNFIDSANRYIPYEINGDELPANIFLSNLEVKLGLTVDECNTDRVFLYTYDDMYYGYDPLDTNLSAAQRSTSRKLQFAWVHLTPTGPVLVNHEDYYPSTNTEDMSSLRYWREHGGADIQWYHYEYGCAQNTTNLAERQGGVNWKYLSVVERDPDDSSPFSIIVYPDYQRAKDRWKAVISVGNVPYATEPLIFTNVDTNVETETFDSLNEIVFRILHEEFNDEANKYNLVEDSSLRNFYFYDINDQAIRNENNRLYSDLDYYIQVWIRNNETGEYSPMTYDPHDGLVDIVFSWPSENTMLTGWSEVLPGELENAVLAPILNGASEQYNSRILSITRKFHIKQNWRASLNNNTVSATVKRRGKTYHPTIQFNFGNVSAMGSNYGLTVSQLSPAGSMIVQNQPFSIEATVLQKEGNEDPNSKYIFSWELLSPTIITSGANDEDMSKNTWNIDNSNGFIGNVLSGVVRNICPPIFKVTVRNAADWTISQTSGFRLVSNAAMADKYIVNSCAERVEFKADGTVPISYYGDFSVEMMTDDVERIEYWPTWSMVQMRKNGDEWITLDTPDYFALKENIAIPRYIASNTNPTIYAPGTTGVPYLDGPFSSEQVSGYETFTYSTIETAIKQAYDDAVSSAIDASTDLLALESAAAEVRDTRLNALRMAASKMTQSYTSYAFNPYTKNDLNAPSWLWDDKLQNYYTYITFRTPDGTFAQAIPFTRNLYSSTLLNSWDGKLSIDDTNNAILSQMVSAGTKSYNGTFTGVVMGNWANNSDSSLDIPGLYGLKDGGQVFGFKTDGSGFIGKSGRGRIVFDGNQSLISNVDHTSYINLDPIRYHYDGSGHIIFDDYQGYSSYFLYSEAKKTSTASLAGEDSLEQSTYWAKDYFNDTSKDYFIVDPNNGILTTGGIVARYGKIGNWMISDTGLYQRYTKTTELSTQNRYMYLGYPGVTDAEINAIKLQYNDQLDLIENYRALLRQDIINKYQMEEFKIVGEFNSNVFDYDPIHYYAYGWPYGLLAQAITRTLREKSEHISNSGKIIDSYRTAFLPIFKEILENEERNGWHWHYRNGQKIENDPQYYGDRYAFVSMLAGMNLFEPYAPEGSEKIKRWCDTSTYGTGERRTVSYEDLATSITTLHGEIVDDDNEIVQEQSNDLPEGLLATDFWFEEENPDVPNAHIYKRVYELLGLPLTILGDLSGYSDLQFAEAFQATLVDEVRAQAVVICSLGSSKRYYVATNAIYIETFVPNMEDEVDENQIVLSMPMIPSFTDTYYSTTYPGEEQYQWSHYCQINNLQDETIESLDARYEVYAENKNPAKGWQQHTIWDYGHLRLVLAYATAIYNYYTDAYLLQLEECANAGLAALGEQQLLEYNRRKELLEAQMRAELKTIDSQIDTLKQPIVSIMQSRISEIYTNDMNRYAIYAGYNDPKLETEPNPLFSVNWRGYMTARAGKIGKESPWYITDYGLTQTNNFGTIFLGNPEAPADKTEWVDLGSDADDLILLPNHDEDNSPLVLGASDNTASRGKFAIYAGNKGWVWSYDSNEDKYTRSEETKATIKFGVRMDGTLYAINGTVGGWNLTQNMLYAGNTEDPADLLVLDANRGVISLGGAIVLKKDGTVTLGKMNDDGVSAGTINIAGVFFKGRSSDQVNYGIPTYSVTSNGWVQEATDYNFWGSTKAIGSANIAAQTATVTTAGIAKTIKYTSLLDICNDDSRPTGITIAIGHEQMNTNDTDTTHHAVAIYPMTLTTENSVLGTSDHPWDMIADVIQCNTLDVLKGNLSAKNMFMYESGSPAGDSTPGYNLVATQFWVRAQLQDVYAQIKDAAAGGSSAGKTARSAASGLSNALNKLGKLLDLLNKYTFFITGIDNDAQSTTKLKLKTLSFTAAWAAIDATAAGEDSVPEGGTEPAATPGEGEEVLINLDAYHLLWSAGGSTLRDVVAAMVPVGTEEGGALVAFNTSTKLLTGGIEAKGGSSVPGLEGTVGKRSAFSISLDHTHEPTFTEPSGTSGTVKLTIGDADFSKTTSSEATFDVVKTSWYADQVVGPGADNDSSSSSTTFALWLTSAQTVAMSKSYSTSLSEDSTNKKVQLKHSGTTIAEISTANTYAAGWNAAITHAKAKASVTLTGGATVATSWSTSNYNAKSYTDSGGTEHAFATTRSHIYYDLDTDTMYSGATINWSSVSSTPV